MWIVHLGYETKQTFFLRFYFTGCFSRTARLSQALMSSELKIPVTGLPHFARRPVWSQTQQRVCGGLTSFPQDKAVLSSLHCGFHCLCSQLCVLWSFVSASQVPCRSTVILCTPPYGFHSSNTTHRICCSSALGKSCLSQHQKPQ